LLGLSMLPHEAQRRGVAPTTGSATPQQGSKVVIIAVTLTRSG
jgi:hypothetical protein